MDKLTEQIYHNVVDYPLIFPSREAALVHLYLITGTEYEWVNGEIKNTSSQTEEDFHKTKKRALKDIREKHYSYKDDIYERFPESLQDRFIEDSYKQTRKLRERVFKAEKIASGEFRHEENITWIDQDPNVNNETKSNLWNIPQDAKEVYVDGAKELLKKRINKPKLFEFPTKIKKVKTQVYKNYLQELNKRFDP